MLNKQMKRLLRGMYIAHTATAVAEAKTGKLQPPGRGTVSTWCKKAWAMITPDVVKMCVKICGLTLALDGSEDHAWCMHNCGEGYRELLQQQHVEWEGAHPDAPCPCPSCRWHQRARRSARTPSWLQIRRWEGSCYPLGRKAGTTWSYWNTTAT